MKTPSTAKGREVAQSKSGEPHPCRGTQSDVTEAGTDRFDQDDHGEHHEHAGDDLGGDVRPRRNRGDPQLAGPSGGSFHRESGTACVEGGHQRPEGAHRDHEVDAPRHCAVDHLACGVVAEEEDVEDHREADGDGEKLPAPQQAPHLESAEGQEWRQAAPPAVACVGSTWPAHALMIRQGRRSDRKIRHLSSRADDSGGVGCRWAPPRVVPHRRHRIW